MPKRSKGVADNDNGEPVVPTQALSLCTSAFKVALTNHVSIALSLPAGTGKRTAARSFRVRHPGAVAVASLQQKGVHLALRRSAAAAAPSLFPQQRSFVFDGGSALLPITPAIPTERLPEYLHLALAQFATSACEAGHAGGLVIVRNMERLKSRSAIDDFITSLADAKADLRIGFVFMGDEKFVLPVFTDATPLYASEFRRGGRPLISASLDLLADAATFSYDQVTDEDIRRFVEVRGYSAAVAEKICHLRRFRRLRPSFHSLNRLLLNVPQDLSDAQSIRIIEDSVSLPMSPLQAA